MVTYRVRRLTRQGHGLVDSAPNGSTLMEIAEQTGAVFEVNAEEKVLTHDQVVHQLDLGLLRLTDLVQIDGQWVSLGDAEPFAPEEAKGEHWEYNPRTVEAVLYAVIVIGILIAVLVQKFLHR